jgi:hypothetical protein
MNTKKIMKIKLFIIISLAVVFLSACSGDSNTNSYLQIGTVGEFHSVDRDYIYNYTDSSEFHAVVRSSGNKPVETEYTGIELSKIFSSLNINTSDMHQVTFNAIDGYKVVLDIDEIYEPNNVYLVFKRDGKYLKTKSQGGSGPFQIVIRQDPFSQRWCKHVSEIIIE